MNSPAFYSSMLSLPINGVPLRVFTAIYTIVT